MHRDMGRVGEGIYGKSLFFALDFSLNLKVFFKKKIAFKNFLQRRKRDLI